jgi:hypothetical protein
MFPPLPLEEWEESKETLRRYVQIVGKVRLVRSPFRNHWWQVPLYVTTRGLATSPIPYRRMTFEISFDLMDNRLMVSTSEGEGFAFAMDDLPVLALRAIAFRTVDPAQAITRYRMLNKHSVSWMTLNPDRPLQAHLWHSVVQSSAEAHPVFRHFRNHYT